VWCRNIFFQFLFSVKKIEEIFEIEEKSDMEIIIMEQSIITFLKKYNCVFNGTTNENDLKLIYDCLINNHIDSDVHNQKNTIVLLYYAFYYDTVRTNPELAKKYYLMAIEKGSIGAMNCFAVWYEKQGDFDNMKKYHLAAIKNNHLDSMYNLALWYGETKDYDNMIKYHLMGAENGDQDCINEINKYFEQVLDVKNMCLAFFFLTDNNKEKLNKIIIDVDNINNINVINETMCIHCKQITACIFLVCSHSVCKKCYDPKLNNICYICNGKNGN
jgi:hypothetical protein